jgi:hypothetical protein
MSAVGGIPANEFSVVVKMDDIGAGASQHVIAANVSADIIGKLDGIIITGKNGGGNNGKGPDKRQCGSGVHRNR